MHLSFSANGTVANADYSPINDDLYWPNSFEQTYFIGLHTTPPDQPLDAFLDYVWFERSHSFAEYLADWDRRLANYRYPLCAQDDHVRVMITQQHDISTKDEAVEPPTIALIMEFLGILLYSNMRNFVSIQNIFWISILTVFWNTR